jgi:formate--tetrahydrofolate ligase
MTAAGFGKYPVCIAKTPNSISHDAKLTGAPKDYIFPLTDTWVYAGAKMIVVSSGNVMLMPGLPEHPAAENIFLNDNEEIKGLF